MAVDRGAYAKAGPVPGLLPYAADSAAHHSDSNAPRTQRPNHRGEFDSVVTRTLLTGSDPWNNGDEKEAAWFLEHAPDFDHDIYDKEGTFAPRDAGTSLYDPEYLKQNMAGHKKSEDCFVRAATTMHMEQAKIERPTPVHW